MQEFIIKEDLLRAINGYLGEKPFREVAGLIGALSQLALVEKKPIENPVENKEEKKCVEKPIEKKLTKKQTGNKEKSPVKK